MIINNKTEIMKFINIAIKASLLLTLISFLASCSKDNLDTTQTIEDPIDIGIDLLDPSLECSNTLTVTLNENLEIINEEGKALIFPLGDCQYNYPYLILVTKGDFDFWGEAPNIIALSHGMPGFAFIANEDTMDGDQLTHYRNITAAGTLFSNGLDEHFYGFNEDVDFIITNFGTEIGDTIKAVIEGNFIDSTSTLIPFKGEFCVPVTYVCE